MLLHLAAVELDVPHEIVVAPDDIRVADLDIIGMKMPSDQKSEGILFHQLQPVISQTSPKGFYIHRPVATFAATN